MKKNAFVIVMGLIMALPISAQSWNSWDTHRTISGVFGIANAAIESAVRWCAIIVTSPIWGLSLCSCICPPS